MAAMLGQSLCPFTPIDWLRAESDASAQPVASPLSITVEARLHAGGMMPWALLGARFEPSTDDVIRFEVGHTGDWKLGERPSCEGPLHRPLVSALPLELAKATLVGLTADGDPLPPGRIIVAAAGCDEVDSSPYAFKRAAHLLRFLLPEALASHSIAKDDVQKAVERCGTDVDGPSRADS